MLTNRTVILLPPSVSATSGVCVSIGSASTTCSFISLSDREADLGFKTRAPR